MACPFCFESCFDLFLCGVSNCCSESINCQVSVSCEFSIVESHLAGGIRSQHDPSNT